MTGATGATEAGALSRVDAPLPGPLAFHHRDATTGALCGGGACVLSFDGPHWQQHACLEN